MRLFIAIPIPPDAREKLHETMETLMQKGVEGRFVPEANYHITLAFLGEVEDPRPVVSVLEKLNFQPVKLCFEGALHFGALLALAMEKNPALERLVSQLREMLDEAGISYDHKAFKGHITLIRKMKNPHDVNLELPSFDFEAGSVHLMQSVFDKEGVHYQSLFCREAG